MKVFVVIGLGRFGISLARTLLKKGYEVLAIDTDEARVDEIADEVTHAVQADATEEKTLKALGVQNYDAAVVSIGGDIQSNIMATLILKELGVEYVLSKASSQIHARLLEKVGADKIVFPESDMGVRVAHNLISSNVLDYIELSPNYSLIEVVSPVNFCGKSLDQLDLRQRYGVNVMAIKRKEDNQVLVNPRADDLIYEGDILIVMGETEGLDKIRGI